MKAKEDNYKTNLKSAKSSITSKQYDKAIEYYGVAKEIKPNSEEAKNGFIKASKLNKEKKQHDLQEHILNGNKFFALGKWEQAVNEFNQAIFIDKSNNKSLSDKLNKAQSILTKQKKLQELAQAKKLKAQERANAIKQMNYFEGSTIQIAVSQVKVTS